jgi:hypothetical protein
VTHQVTPAMELISRRLPRNRVANAGDCLLPGLPRSI